MLYRRFERFINIFHDAPTDSPPSTVWSFYLYYLRQVWPSFAALLVVGLASALIEVSLFSYLSPDALVRPEHPLRAIRPLVNAALQRLSSGSRSSIRSPVMPRSR